MKNLFVVIVLKILQTVIGRFLDPEKVKEAYINKLTKSNHKAIELAEEHFLIINERILRIIELSKIKSGKREKKELKKLLEIIKEEKKDFFKYKKSP